LFLTTSYLEAHKAAAQFNNEQISTIDGNKPPPCPVDPKDDYCNDGKMAGKRQ
jgi:hypothetical protein